MDWLTAPVFRSLLEPQMFLGMPRMLGMLTAILTMAMVLGAGQYWFAAVFVVVVFVFRKMSNEDVYFFDVFRALVRLPDVMD